MAIVKRDVVGGNASAWANYFSQFTDSFITADTTTGKIYIDESNDFYIYRNSYRYDIYINGSVIASQPTTNNNDTITVGSSQTLFYMCSHNYSSREDYCFIIAQKINNVLIYYISVGQTSSLIVPLNYTWTYTDLYTGTSYNHKILLNYLVDINKIDYAEDNIYSSDTKVLSDPDLITCTTIEPNSVITFNGKNYFAIGTNTLIPMDE